MEPRHGGAPVDSQPGCAGYPPTWYMAAKLSAWQEGDAQKTLSLRAPCSQGLTTRGLGGHRRHGAPTKCKGVRTFGYAAGLHNANAAAGMRLASPAHGGYKATVQTTDTPRSPGPPPPTQGAKQPGWGERRGPGEHPGEGVGARGGGRGRARRWHTQGTARDRQGGQTYRQEGQREGEWEGRQARERAQGSGTRVARRRAGGTQGAREQQGTRAQNQKKKTAAGQADTQEGHKEEAGRGRWGE